MSAHLTVQGWVDIFGGSRQFWPGGVAALAAITKAVGE